MSVHSVTQPYSLEAGLCYTDSDKLSSLYATARLHLPVTTVVFAVVGVVVTTVVVVVISSLVIAVRVVMMSPSVVAVVLGRSSVVPSVGSPAVGKSQGAEEGNDDEKKNGLGVHCEYVYM